MTTRVSSRATAPLLTLALAQVLALTSASPANAQGRLTGATAASAGIIVEAVSFGRGMDQATAGNVESSIKSVSQWLIPVSAAVPLSETWAIDVGITVSHGQVKFESPPANITGNTVSLGGMSDVRVRLNGRLLDNLLLTIGGNAPTGSKELTNEETAALGVLAAPALGIYLPPVSLGPSGTAGLVYSRQIGDWGWAAGASYEMRGQFSPIAALAAGLPSPEFDPGSALHLSLGTEGVVGRNALGITLTTDMYTDERLMPGGAATAGSAATVQLGPTIGAEVQYKIAAESFRDLTVYVSELHRGSFDRDGSPVAGSSANYLYGGVRAVRPLSPQLDLTGNVDAWWHSGLSVDNSLVTSAATSGAATVGLSRRFGIYALEPFVRGRVGSLNSGVGTGQFTGITGGLTLAARF